MFLKMKKKDDFFFCFVLDVLFEAFLLKTKWGNCGPSIETEQVSNIEENNSTGMIFIVFKL